MAEPIAYEVVQDGQAGVAVLRLDAAPGAGLTQALQDAFCQALDRAGTDPDVQAVVLVDFQGSLGDTLALDDAARLAQSARLQDLCARLEDMPCPVVAALDGPVLGGMLELALAAQGRVAGPAARIGLPDVALGLLPMAGATQRLPRLCGVRAALELLLAPRPVSVRDPRAAGLLDRLAEGEVLPVAVSLARELAAQPGGRRRNRDLPVGAEDPLGYQSEIAAARERLEASPEEAPLAILRAVEAAQLMPFDTGLAYEAEEAEQALRGDQSAALRHLARAERLVWQREDFTSDPTLMPPRIGSAGVVGGGMLAVELGVVLLDAGLRVRLHARDEGSGRALGARIAAIYDKALARGRMNGAERKARLDRLEIGTALDPVAACDLVVETTGADAEARGVLLERLARAAPVQAVLATIGPAGALAQIADATGRPGRVLALRPGRPAHIRRLVEVAAHPGTEVGALQAVTNLLLGARRIVVHSAPRDLPLAEEMRLARHYAALTLIDRGLRAAALEQAAPGVLQEIDAAGLEPLRDGIAAAELPVPGVLTRLIDEGRTGQGAGRGFLLWPEGEVPLPDPALDALLAGLRPDRPMALREVTALLLAGTANRGAALLREEQALRPGDLDVAMVYARAWPKLAGGPMHAADRMGLFEVKRAMDRFVKQAAPAGAEAFWQCDPLLESFIRNGRHLAELDRPALPDLPPPELP